MSKEFVQSNGIMAKIFVIAQYGEKGDISILNKRKISEKPVPGMDRDAGVYQITQMNQKIRIFNGDLVKNLPANTCIVFPPEFHQASLLGIAQQNHASRLQLHVEFSTHQHRQMRQI